MQEEEEEEVEEAERARMDINAFRDGVLNEHNSGRLKYGNVPPLCLDANINKEAQEYAEKLAIISMTLRHSKRTHLGKLAPKRKKYQCIN